MRGPAGPTGAARRGHWCKAAAASLGTAALLAGAVLTAGATWETGRSAPCRSGCPVRHIIIVVRENHSFDNLFGRFPGADGATRAREGRNVVRLGRTPDRLLGDLGHSSADARLAIDGGRMDRFARLHNAWQNGRDVADSQYFSGDTPAYWAYARRYSLADHFFSTVASDSFPNHLVLVAGQNLGAIDIKRPDRSRSRRL